MAKKLTVLDNVGNTPLTELFSFDADARILAKLEYCNPSGSVKARPALNMVRAAEKRGEIGPGSTVVEATSGNQGIALSMVASVKGYDCIIVMPELMSEERQHMIRAYGAEVRLTPAGNSIKEAIDNSVAEARRLSEEREDCWWADQFRNTDNVRAHRETTAREILRQVDGPIDAFVSGIGTGGTITGVGETLKHHFPDMKIFAVEPEAAAILTNGSTGHHIQQGIGDGLIPEILNCDIIDDTITVTDEAAAQTTRRLAFTEGIFCGVSSGSNVRAANKVAQLMPGTTIVTLLPDRGERYISMCLFSPDESEQR